jgi:hypothetical protein
VSLGKTKAKGTDGSEAVAAPAETAATATAIATATATATDIEQEQTAVGPAEESGTSAAAASTASHGRHSPTASPQPRPPVFPPVVTSFPGEQPLLSYQLHSFIRCLAPRLTLFSAVQTDSPLSTALSLASTPASSTPASSPAVSPAQPESQEQLRALLEEGTLLSAAERQSIQDFFAHKGDRLLLSRLKVSGLVLTCGAIYLQLPWLRRIQTESRSGSRPQSRSSKCAYEMR